MKCVIRRHVGMGTAYKLCSERPGSNCACDLGVFDSLVAVAEAIHWLSTYRDGEEFPSGCFEGETCFRDNRRLVAFRVNAIPEFEGEAAVQSDVDLHAGTFEEQVKKERELFPGLRS